MRVDGINYIILYLNLIIRNYITVGKPKGRWQTDPFSSNPVSLESCETLWSWAGVHLILFVNNIGPFSPNQDLKETAKHISSETQNIPYCCWCWCWCCWINLLCYHLTLLPPPSSVSTRRYFVWLRSKARMIRKKKTERTLVKAICKLTSVRKVKAENLI